MEKNRRDFLKKSLAGGVLVGSVASAMMTKVEASSPLVIPKADKKPTLEQNLEQFSKGERITTKGYAALDKNASFVPYSFSRHPVGATDILIEIDYAGICHSDLHGVYGDFGRTTYPIVPGHEIAGRVVAVGKDVRKFKVGDYAGVGCMVNSCGECNACKRSEEQFCENGKTVFTYNSTDVYHNNENTYGGYSSNIVVSEKFAIKVSNDAKMAQVAPLLCAGVTVWAPIKYSNVKKGDKVAVAGFGGLGHMAVKYLVALGADVSVFDVSEAKRADAFKMGAKNYYNVITEDIKKIKNQFSFILSTIPYEYNLNTYQSMLKIDGEMAIVGLPVKADISAPATIWNFRRKIYSSLIGGIQMTQEMLDFSIKHNIYPEIEIIGVEDITKAYTGVEKGDVKFRYVIDMKTLS